MSARMRRVDESVRQVLSEGIRDLKDPRLGFVTVTGVRTTRDLKQAKVFVSVLGSEKSRERTLTGLRSAHGVLQALVAQELRLKRTPLLEFEHDDSVAEGVRLSKLIDELAPADDASADDAADEPRG